MSACVWLTEQEVHAAVDQQEMAKKAKIRKVTDEGDEQREKIKKQQIDQFDRSKSLINRLKQIFLVDRNCNFCLQIQSSFSVDFGSLAHSLQHCVSI